MREYRYDLHVHTKETSRCGYVPAAETVDLYRRLGYDGIAVTDHLHEEYIQSLDCRDDWDACVSAYLKGYRAAKAQGERQGLEVVLGLELRFLPNGNDFLVFGVDEVFLRANPYLHRTDIRRFWGDYHNQVLILQAHPYRGGGVDLAPQCLHGIEVINCNPRHDSHNDWAMALAQEHPHLLGICSSDAHRPGDEGRAAMLFDRPLSDSHDCKAALERGGYRMESPAFSHLLEQAGAAKLTHPSKEDA